MIKEVRARYSNGHLELLEKLNIEEGAEVIVTISDHRKGTGMSAALEATAGAWKDLINCDELKRNIYADRTISTRPIPRL